MQNIVKMEILSEVPARLEGWEDAFQIPTQYSERTMLALTKKQLNSSARSEIVQGISAKIFNHCKYPTSSQVTPFVTNLYSYTCICSLIPSV